MNPGLVVKLRPTGPWRIGPDSGARNRVDLIYHSDTLYAAVTGALARLGPLEEWLAATARNGAPEVCFSSCFPFLDEIGFVVPPRTVWPPTSPALLSARVRWKSARFVPLGIVQAMISGRTLAENDWSVDAASECLVPAGRPGPFRTGMRWNAAVDRLSGSAERHSVACIEFRPGAGLWTVVSFASDAAAVRWLEPVKTAFRLLADSGFGGERSRGWGRSEAPEFLLGELPEMILPAMPAMASGPPREEPPAKEPPAEEPPSGQPPVEEPPPEPEPGPTPEEPLTQEAAVLSTPDIRPLEVDPAAELPLPEPQAAPPAEEPALELPTPEPQAAPSAETAFELPMPEPQAATPTAETAVELPVPEPQAAAPAEPETELRPPENPDESAPKAFAMDSNDAELPAPEPQAVTPPTPEPHLPPPDPEPSPEPVPPIPEPAPEPAPEPLPPEPEPAPPPAPPDPDTPEPLPPAMPEPEPMPAFSSEAPERHPQWLLSLFSPAASDSVDWERGSYAVVARGGRIESGVRSGELKKQLPMIAEGSVLYATAALRGSAPDVAPDGFAHPVYRAGFAVSIPLPEVS